MPSVTLRFSQVADATAMVALQRASWLAAYGAVLGDDLLEQMSEQQHLEVWQTRIAKSDQRPLLVCLDDVPVGLLYWQCEDNIAWLRAFYLHPDHWRQGLGQRLWLAVSQQMRRAGCQEARLWLLHGNRVGAAFYFKQGFRPAGERRTLHSLGRDCQQFLLARAL